MPGKKRRYNVRFPPSRIKKIMQKDKDVGRIAMAVPVIISRALEIFLKSLLTKTCRITQSKSSSVVSVAHTKQCIWSEKLFHFLRDLVKRGTAMATQKDSQGPSMWPVFRTKGYETSVRKTAEIGAMAPHQTHDSLVNGSSTSDSELYIYL